MSKNHLTRQTAADKLGFNSVTNTPDHFTTKADAVTMGSNESLLEGYADTDFVRDDDVVKKAGETVLFSANLIGTLNDDNGKAPVQIQKTEASETGAYFNADDSAFLRYDIGNILQNVNRLAVEFSIYHTKNTLKHSHLFHFNTTDFWLLIWCNHNINPNKQITFTGGIREGKAIVNNIWYKLREEYDYTTHVLRAFINDNLIGKTTLTGSTAEFRPVNFELGRGVSIYDHFKGYMKDFKIIDLGI